MFTERFLRDKRGAALDADERCAIEAAVSEIREIPPRSTVVRAGQPVQHSTLLIDGIMSRYIDDRQGMRQLAAVHFPGDFVDLHAFPLKVLEHDVQTTTLAQVAIVPHAALEEILAGRPQLIRKLWFATLIDAAMHRAWLFRLGRLDAVGRVAHFLCETNARLVAAGLSDGRRFALALTQSDLAEICGLTSVHVNRVMRQMREERLCVFRSSFVEIPDPARLAARSQFNPEYLYLEQTEPFRSPVEAI
ncbi:Crp/Fnr family transcriptional regulator [Novosphingobium sp.]|uniref:Crp/Fnr family transcriptional regulator n=1 Tax=Novosphingobium sp. TaxID=1874826 RepID=UPI00260C98FE|nr:Crp/Fnr family transcriptional regulator [Novosphingobium sp.]